MSTQNIIVLPYDDKWEVEFEKIKIELVEALTNCHTCIEHVGSTSVKGLSAKPIIDIDVVISIPECFITVVERLAVIGYVHEGDLGIKGREAFKYAGKEHLMEHHVYVCPENSEELRRHITFRDYLRAHKDAVAEYSRVKDKAALLYPHDIDRYIEYKSHFIRKIYQLCGLQV